MNFIKNFSKTIFINFARMPFSVISIYISTLILIYFILSGDKISDSYLLKIAIYFVVAYFLSSSFYLFKNRLLPILASAILGAIYYIYGKDLQLEYYIYWSIFLIIASIFISFWAPFYKKEATNVEIFNQIKGVLGSLVFSFMLSLLLIAGVFIAFVASHKLFGVHISDKAYGVVAVLAFGVFGANYYLNQLQTIELNQPTNRAEELFAKYILPSFTVGYFVILYAYTAKILITASFPKGYLAWFILFFTLVAWFSYLFLTPYNSRFRKLILIAIIPQAIMLLLAVYQRVAQYSITESRYMLVIYGLFLIFASIYLLFKDRYKPVLIAATVVLFFSQIAPFSALNIAKGAQYKRFVKSLKSYKNGDKSIKTKYKLSSAIEYLASRWGIEAFRDVLPNIAKKYDTQQSKYSRYNVKYFVCKELGFSYISRFDYLRENRSVKKDLVYLQKEVDYVDIKDYDWFIKGSGYLGYKELVKRVDKINTDFIFKKDALIVKTAKSSIEIDLKEYLKKLDTERDRNLLEYNYNANGIKLKLLINYISIENKKIKEIRFAIFYKRL